MENETVMEPMLEKEKEERKRYMREYKRRKYAEDTEEARRTSLSYYYKTRYDLTPEEFREYGRFSPNIVKIKKNMSELYSLNPELAREMVRKMMAEML